MVGIAKWRFFFAFFFEWGETNQPLYAVGFKDLPGQLGSDGPCEIWCPIGSIGQF